MNIVLCDLSHQRDGKYSSEMVPYPVGCIKSYFHAYGSVEADIELFKSPFELSSYLERADKNELEGGFPKIFGFSCYMWNHNLSLAFAGQIKKKYPDSLIIFGGPDFPLELIEKEKWLKQRPQIDFYIEGEGEKPFLEIAEKFSELNFSLEKIKQSKFNSVFSIKDGILDYEADFARDNFVKSARIENLGLTPSPYLMGYLDKFLEGDQLVPLMESNRGCPFTCTFCVDGNASRTKVYKVSPNRLEDELLYIAKRYKGSTLALADTNFGMFKEDVEFSKIIAKIKAEYNYPAYINTSTGKNQKERIIECAELLKGTMRVAASIQSLDKVVLTNIKRSNISENELISMSVRLSGGISNTYSELILCLPGDTKAKHLETLDICLDAGYNQIRMHTLTLLDGSVLGTTEEKQKYEFITRHRGLQRSFGSYPIMGEDLHVIETEEVVIGQNSMQPEDYLDCRVYNLTVAVFYNENIFWEIAKYLKSIDLKVSGWIRYIAHHILLDDGVISEQFQNFRKMTHDELYENKEEISSTFSKDALFRSDVFNGKKGYNLLLDTQGEILIHHTEELVGYAVQSLREYLRECNHNINSMEEVFLDQLEKYLVLKRVDVLNNHSPLLQEFSFNFPKIFNEEVIQIPSNENKQLLKFQFDEARMTLINDQIKLYGKTKEGVGKMIARSPIKDFQREACVIN